METMAIRWVGGCFKLVVGTAVWLVLSAPFTPGAWGAPFTVTFQQGVDGYAGTQDTMLRYRSNSENLNYGGEETYTAYGNRGRDEPDRMPGLGTKVVLIQFSDLIGPAGIPESITGGQVLGATLTMTSWGWSLSNSATHGLRVFQMLMPWNAGSSLTTEAADGESTAAHRFHRTDPNDYTAADYWGNTGSQVPWPVAGVDFVSARITDWWSGDDGLDTSWGRDEEDDPGLNAYGIELDILSAVQDWVNDPSSNHGLLLGVNPNWPLYEMYSSSWEDDPEWRPMLTIQYIPEPGSALLLGLGAALVMFLKKVKPV